MDRLWHTVRSIVAEMLGQQGQSRHGIVKSVDPARGTVRVALDEFGTLSGWIPVAQTAAGGGWSGVCLPVPGTQVFMVPDMGHSEHLVVVGATHSTEQPPGKVTPYQGSAQNLVPGEVTFMHKDGASLRLTASGVIEIHGDLKVDGNILASGNITDLNNQRNSLDYLRTQYDEHHHTNVQTGAGITGLTDHPTP